MDVTALVQQLQAERPDLMPALRSAIDSVPDRTALNTLLTHLLQLQQALNHKRELAKDLLIVRTGVVGGPTMSTRHHPDVTVRKLCAIAEVPHHTTAGPDWLDAMERRETERTLTRYEERP